MTSDPRALVVFESMFGNTERIASAVARGLRLAGLDTAWTDVGSAPQELDPDLDLLVVGAPTHAFSMSRPSTRAEAVAQGAPSDHAEQGLREWLASVRIGSEPVRPGFAAFDTRVTKVRWLPQAAGPSAGRAARRRGLEKVAKPMGFLVEDTRGPLVAGELDRAVAWGRSLGQSILERPTVTTAPGTGADRPRDG